MTGYEWALGVFFISGAVISLVMLLVIVWVEYTSRETRKAGYDREPYPPPCLPRRGVPIVKEEVTDGD